MRQRNAEERELNDNAECAWELGVITYLMDFEKDAPAARKAAVKWRNGINAELRALGIRLETEVYR